MLPVLFGAAVFGLATAIKSDQSSDEETLEEFAPSSKDIDDLLIGRLRDENYKTGSNFLSENIRIVRPTIGRKNPVRSAKEWTNYHRKHNQVLHDLYAKNEIANTTRILRADSNPMNRLLFLPFPTANLAAWKNIPNVHFDYHSRPSGKYHIDNDNRLYDDQAGHATGNPEGGWPYVWDPQSWHGNPWGPAGQLFHNLRSENNMPSAYGEPPAKLKNDKRVRFGGTTRF